MQILTAPGLYRNRNVHCTALLSFLSLSRRFIRRNLYTSYQSHLHIEFLPLPDSKNSSTSPLSFPKFSFRIKNRSTYSGTTKHRSLILSLNDSCCFLHSSCPWFERRERGWKSGGGATYPDMYIHIHFIQVQGRTTYPRAWFNGGRGRE